MPLSNTMKMKGLRAWNRLFGWKRRAEARSTLRHVEQFLAPGSTILDIGCGNGMMLDVAEEDYGCIGFGIDVGPPPTRIPRFAIFDGLSVPFADQSVDIALFVFVLHHANDPGELLREAARVARHQVIVIEDTPESHWERRWSRLHIRSFASRHRIPWQGLARSEEEWRHVFHFCRMPLLHTSKLGRFERLPPVTRTAFVLQANATGAGSNYPRTATS